MNSQTSRLDSIDVFRALTMFFMIFVNDLWTLKEVPMWLEHATAQEDRLGFADTIFPAFLFIVGLSIPFAISGRLKRGDSVATLSKHILLRGMALITMGVFHVNGENYNRVDAVLPKPIWGILVTVGFFLIWLDYPRDISKSKKYVLQGAGILILAVMAALYQGGTHDNPEWMRLRWYGILGLIGWAYLICSFIYLFLRENLWGHLLAFTFFVFFNSAGELGWLQSISSIRPYVWIVGEGSIQALVMAGIIVSLCYKHYMGSGRFWGLMGMFALATLLFGFLTRPLWGIHKIGASPSWVTICIGLSLIVFVAMIMLVDQRGKKDWFNVIKPAGTSTLTCYLVPYLYYPIYSLIGISLPIAVRTGFIGIVKSLLFALLIILITGFLEKRKIRLKL